MGDEVMASNDATRKTYVLIDKKLQAMPDGMRMMVPVDLDALDASELFSAEAKQAYRDEVGRAEELRASAPEERRERCGVCAAALWRRGAGEDWGSAAERRVWRRCGEAERAGGDGSVCGDGAGARQFDRGVAGAGGGFVKDRLGVYYAAKWNGNAGGSHDRGDSGGLDSAGGGGADSSRMATKGGWWGRREVWSGSMR